MNFLCFYIQVYTYIAHIYVDRSSGVLVKKEVPRLHSRRPQENEVQTPYPPLTRHRGLAKFNDTLYQGSPQHGCVGGAPIVPI